MRNVLLLMLIGCDAVENPTGECDKGDGARVCYHSPDAASTYIQQPPFLEGITAEPAAIAPRRRNASSTPPSTTPPVVSLRSTARRCARDPTRIPDRRSPACGAPAASMVIKPWKRPMP